MRFVPVEVVDVGGVANAFAMYELFVRLSFAKLIERNQFPSHSML